MATADPIEILLDGIVQTAIDLNQGLDYPTVIRAFLRQDPDVIMIGEIRDSATLNAAILASTTGHLVISSIHSYDAKSTINRLKTLGCKQEIAYSILNTIVSQRLVRKICNVCKQEKPNCAYCIEGYHGVRAIFEVLAIKNGNKLMPTPSMRSMGEHLVHKKIINLKELNRVLGDV